MFPCQREIGTKVYWIQDSSLTWRSGLSIGIALRTVRVPRCVPHIPTPEVSGSSREVFKNIDHLSVDLNHDLTYRERPVRILDEDVRLTRRRTIKFYKVQWSNHTEEEATWEREDYLQTEFPDLFSTQT